MSAERVNDIPLEVQLVPGPHREIARRLRLPSDTELVGMRSADAAPIGFPGMTVEEYGQIIGRRPLCARWPYTILHHPEQDRVIRTRLRVVRFRSTPAYLELRWTRRGAAVSMHGLELVDARTHAQALLQGLALLRRLDRAGGGQQGGGEITVGLIQAAYCEMLRLRKPAGADGRVDWLRRITQEQLAADIGINDKTLRRTLTREGVKWSDIRANCP